VNQSYTVDASVWVSAFLPADIHYQDSRATLAELLARGAALPCPALVLAEVAAAVARNTVRQDLAIQAMETVRDFPGLVMYVLDATLSEEAARLAAAQRLRGADATYVAVAARARAVLLTWDQEMHDRGAAAAQTLTPDIWLATP